jgi:hypothetical protein
MTSLEVRSSPDASAPDSNLAAHDIRWLANLLQLALYCPFATCRRSHRCRGHTDRCIQRYTRYVPPLTMRGAKAILEARKVQQDYEERTRRAAAGGR